MSRDLGHARARENLVQMSQRIEALVKARQEA